MRRPAGVTILAVLNYLVGAYLFVGSMFGLLALWLGPFAVVFWGVNALFFGLGYGLWKLRDWARWTQIVLSMIIAVGCLLLTILMLHGAKRRNHPVPVAAAGETGVRDEQPLGRGPRGAESKRTMTKRPSATRTWVWPAFDHAKRNCSRLPGWQFEPCLQRFPHSLEKRLPRHPGPHSS